ncbi:hypothetical protein GCM10020256_00630 [Streptomyces thermocoprophilus]
MHADREGVVRDFHGLDGSVAGPSGDGEAAADAVHRLVVVARRLRLVLVEDAGDPAAGQQLQRLTAQREVLRPRTVAVMPRDVRQVLVQGAPRAAR